MREYIQNMLKRRRQQEALSMSPEQAALKAFEGEIDAAAYNEIEEQHLVRLFQESGWDASTSLNGQTDPDTDEVDVDEVVAALSAIQKKLEEKGPERRRVPRRAVVGLFDQALGGSPVLPGSATGEHKSPA